MRQVFWPGCFLRSQKEKLRFWTVVDPGTEQKYVRESPYKNCREGWDVSRASRDEPPASMKVPTKP